MRASRAAVLDYISIDADPRATAPAYRALALACSARFTTTQQLMPTAQQRFTTTQQLMPTAQHRFPTATDKVPLVTKRFPTTTDKVPFVSGGT